MPAIMPAPGDLIEVTLTAGGLSPAAPPVMLATMKTKDPSGKWEIELAGDPPMRGKVDAANYEWEQESRRWRRAKPDVRPVPARPIEAQRNIEQLLTQQPGSGEGRV